MVGIFVSHATADDAIVADLRGRLEAGGHPTWVDSRRLAGGDPLALEAAIVEATAFIVVLSPHAVNSTWVPREVRAALAVQRERGAGFRVVPLLLPGVAPSALGLWFPEEPVAVMVGPDGLEAAMPAVWAALGVRLPTDPEPPGRPEAAAVAELVLRLSDPRIVDEDGVRRARATAQLVHTRPGHREVEGRRFAFTAPLGPIEAADLRWYLESYHLWPVGVFRERAAAIEGRLPRWGRELFAACGDSAVLDGWARAGGERRFSVLVDDDPPVDAPPEAAAAAKEAATELLSLPWELLHDGTSWLFQGRDAVRVRRRLPNRTEHDERPTALPIRILLVSPRPERAADGRPVGYLDHRVSARPLVDAVEHLGELARLTVLASPTYTDLEKALDDGDGGAPFDVVHFDGHGVYDRRLGLGGLCFEQPATGRGERALDFVDAARLAGLVRRHRIPLVFLEACQTAVADTDPTASVAARLLEEGVASVVAMSHSVLVETARRFVEAFYAELARGVRVGAAMLAGQRALFADPRRGAVPGAGELRLHDWFVPVLYQERVDPQPVTRLPAPTVQRLAAQQRRLDLGDLPAPPDHDFHGRSRELLALERHLAGAQWAVVRGTGGHGKTTLAVELARWLVRTGRARRAVFVPLDTVVDLPGVLDAIGRQLVPDYTVAAFPDLDRARLPVERALTDHPVVLVLDNCESVLPDPDVAAGILDLVRRLLDAAPTTRLLATTREPLPRPFARRDHEWELGALALPHGVELVTQVMTQHGWAPPPTDPGTTPDEITALVEAVHCHARALVLLAREVAERGVRATTADLGALMADLDRAHPGDRENSLYASVELSLRRLPAGTRRHVDALAACHGGVHLNVLAILTGLDVDAARQVCLDLIRVGLGEDVGDGHLRLDPALAPYLLTGTGAEDADDLGIRWGDAMIRLTGSLDAQRSQDAGLVNRLTLLELPNLLAMLDGMPDRLPPEQVVDVATRVEGLLENMGQSRALAHATRIREHAAEQLTGWTGARHHAASAEIGRLWQRGDLPAALIAAQRLLEQHVAGGEGAYPGAPYDTATALAQLGRALRVGGAAQAALAPLREARGRFQDLAETDDRVAASMVAATISEEGDCLQILGRLEEAAVAYRDSAERATRLGDHRAAAVAEGQLATVFLRQRRYQDALDGHARARATFRALGEPRFVAVSWHQTGIVLQEAGQHDAAEDAYRHALAIHVREADPSGRAATLGQLGNLYFQQGRLEEAADFQRQQAEIRTRSRDHSGEGRARNNLARTLLDLQRHDEAREEVQRALACKHGYGHAAEIWRTWTILADLERATGRPDSSRAARQQAVDAYLAYRRDGGASHSNRDTLFVTVAEAVRDDRPAELARELDGLVGPDTGPWAVAVVRALQAVLAGARDPALADDPDIDSVDAAELLLLLETLDRPPPPTETT